MTRADGPYTYNGDACGEGVDIYVYGIFLSFDCPVATQVLTIGPVR